MAKIKEYILKEITESPLKTTIAVATAIFAIAFYIHGSLPPAANITQTIDINHSKLASSPQISNPKNESNLSSLGRKLASSPQIFNPLNKSNLSSLEEKQTKDTGEPESIGTPPPSTGYSLANKYTGDSLEPSCVPASAHATCSSPDSCVDCSGKCWSPGSYDNGKNGKNICSQGKWTIIKDTGYSLTNIYTVDSLEPSCVPASAHATCSSPDSCVDCSGKCWSPGSYDNGKNGKNICSQGKWTIS
jgi:hypothetical protein